MDPLSEKLRIFIHTIGSQGSRRFVDSDMPISLKQHHILLMIAQTDEVIQTGLAEVMQKDKSAVLREIDALERLGLVQRQNDATDRRKKRLLITQKGMDLCSQGKEIMGVTLKELTAGISAQEMENFTAILDRIIKNGQTLSKK